MTLDRTVTRTSHLCPAYTVRTRTIATRSATQRTIREHRAVIQRRHTLAILALDRCVQRTRRKRRALQYRVSTAAISRTPHRHILTLLLVWEVNLTTRIRTSRTSFIPALHPSRPTRHPRRTLRQWVHTSLIRTVELTHLTRLQHMLWAKSQAGHAWVIFALQVSSWAWDHCWAIESFLPALADRAEKGELVRAGDGRGDAVGEGADALV